MHLANALGVPLIAPLRPDQPGAHRARLSAPVPHPAAARLPADRRRRARRPPAPQAVLAAVAEVADRIGRADLRGHRDSVLTALPVPLLDRHRSPDLFPHAQRRLPRGRRRQLRARAGRDARHRRRIRLGQVGHLLLASWGSCRSRPAGSRAARRSSTAIDLLRCPPKVARSIRGKRIAMIFQDPMTSLNPYLRISEQLIEPLLIHEKISRADALRRGAGDAGGRRHQRRRPAHRPLSARILRRHAPARHDRDGAHHPARSC